MALDKLTKVQSVGISSFIQVVGVVTATQGFDGNITGIITATGDLTFGANSRAKLFENGTQSGVQATNSGSSAHLMTHDGNEDIHVDPSGYIKVEVAGSERLRIASNGNTGIGTDNPDATLKVNVASGNNGVVVQNTSTANIALIGARNGDTTLQIGQWGSTASGTTFGLSNANLAFIYTTTYNTTHPSALALGTVSNKPIVFATNNTERLRITSDGRLLLGTTNAGGNNTANHLVVSNNAGANDQAGMTIRGGTSGRSQIFFSDGTSGQDEYRGMLRYDHQDNSMQFRTNAVEKLRIDSGGTVHVNSPDTASGGRIYAASSKLYLQSGNGRQSFNIADMAAGQSATHEFNSSGNLVLASGSGIDFSANSNASGTTSEVLDDYEEGAFDPRLRFGTSTEIGTFNTQSKAEYVKVGKIVHVSGWARYDSVNTGNSGILHLDLPFTVDEYGMPHNYVYPGSVVLTHTDLQQKGIHVWCGNAGAARTRFGFYNSTSGSTDYVENGDLAGWNGNTRNLHFNFSYQTND